MKLPQSYATKMMQPFWGPYCILGCKSNCSLALLKPLEVFDTGLPAFAAGLFPRDFGGKVIPCMLARGL